MIPAPTVLLPQEIIRRKRDGQSLPREDIRAFVAGITDGRVTEAQAAAFAMAVCCRGMDMAERVALTLAMRDSGTVVDWRPFNLPGPVVDKHSSGGVGDKTSLILAPALAACGAFVPMVSGRGLGHTGGTLDKFESIPGYDALPGLDRLARVVADAGCAVVGATPEVAPADKRLYAIRDVTGTVESLDLITASILSKKLAAGLQGLVMDVTFGNGAFMATQDAAAALAHSIAGVARGAGLPTVALLTDMNQVLGWAAGNAVEMHEAIAILRAEPPEPRLYEVTATLAAELLALCGLAADAVEGRRRFDTVIADGRAAERFARMVAALGGPADLLEHPDRHLPVAPVVRPVFPDRAGVVAAMDTRAVGIAIVRLGGGRVGTGDRIDHRVGFSAVAGVGDAVGPGGRPLAMVHAATVDAAEAAARALRTAVTVSIADAAPVAGPLIPLTL